MKQIDPDNENLDWRYELSGSNVICWECFPDKKDNIIYADPPWSYDDKNKSGNRELKYDTMNIDDLKFLPIQNITADDCFLFMWATFPMLPDAFELIKAWDFEYKTVAFTWIKENPNGTVFLGMGNYTRSNPELVLLAKKGNPKVISHSVENHIRAKIKGHSKKPDIIRKKIVELCGDVPRIELFARTRIHGWDVVGNDEKLNNKPLEQFF